MKRLITIFTLRFLSVTVLLFTSHSHGEIVLQFTGAGANPTSINLVFDNLITAPTVDGGPSQGTFAVVESSLVGATGTMRVTMAGTDKSTPADPANWAFGPPASIHSSQRGYGVQSVGDSGGKTQMSAEEAILMSFDLSDLILSDGATLVFRIKSEDGESFQIYQRTGNSEGNLVASLTAETPATTSEAVLISGYEPATGIFEFAIVNSGWSGGGANRILEFSLDVLGGTPLPLPPKLDNVFTNHMVLQRDREIVVYGSGEPGSELTVNFSSEAKNVTVDETGKWTVNFNSKPASFAPLTLTVSDGIFSDSISDILVGDVWIASGQSNMDRTFDAFESLDTAGRLNSNIRLLTVERFSELEPSDTLVIDPKFNNSWQICTEDILGGFSATAYFYAATLEENLNIPIGVIEAAFGGTVAESWTPPSKIAELGYSTEGSSGLYNAMIHPLRNFPIKGVVWYQGESNSRRPVAYEALFRGLITSWREVFGQPDMPFYFAQLSALAKRGWDDSGEAWPWLRETQTAALRLPATGMAVTIDAGEYGDIHPQDKETVGVRLALHALKAEDFNVVADSPLYSDMHIDGNEITVSFVNAENGLETREVRMNRNINLDPGTDPEAFVVSADRLAGFVICGADGVFVEADARIEGSTVIVSSPLVPEPIAVRYGWEWFPLCNLYSTDGLPASPFRTDNFVFGLPGAVPVVEGVAISADPAMVGDDIEILVSASDADGDILEYRIDPGDGSGFSEWILSNGFTTNYLNADVYEFLVQVRDSTARQTESSGSVAVGVQSPVRYEAEGFFDAGVPVVPNYATHDGSLTPDATSSQGYNVKLQGNDSITLTVNSELGSFAEIGLLTFSPRANSTRSVDIYVNGLFQATVQQTEDVWIINTLANVPLNTGSNEIRIVNPSSGAGLHIDYIEILEYVPVLSERFEAEDANLDNALIQTRPDASGGTYAKLRTNSSFITWIFPSENSDTVDLTFSILSPNRTRDADLFINGSWIGTIEASINTWSDWDVSGVSLDAGNNTITLANESGGGIEVDYMEVSR